MTIMTLFYMTIMEQFSGIMVSDYSLRTVSQSLIRMYFFFQNILL